MQRKLFFLNTIGRGQLGDLGAELAALPLGNKQSDRAANQVALRAFEQLSGEWVRLTNCAVETCNQVAGRRVVEEMLETLAFHFQRLTVVEPLFMFQSLVGLGELELLKGQF